MRKKYHILKRIRLRQTWNKYNLFNLSRMQPQRTELRTFFQQKWEAKASTRAYHGETVREKMWTRMFRRTIRAVVPTDPTYLAKHDGSEHAEGRGSGVERPLSEKTRRVPKIPHLHMVYAPLERRLDTAIFRALFASSTRQARQFVVHGNVKVNGKKMIYPGYQLNPGDMFQVDPERVLYATGAPKDTKERRSGRLIKKRAAARKARAAEEAEAADGNSNESTAEAAKEPTSQDRTPKQTLQQFVSQAKELLSTPSTSLTAKRKQELRDFQRSARRALSRPDALMTASLDSQLKDITSRMRSAPEKKENETKEAEDVPKMSTSALQAEAASLNEDQIKILRQALAEARENPVDASKPYATPWRPRDFMSVFAFIPRYLEVHPKICAAVYVRHPVARPGLAEVPTPFNAETNALAHNWYLRRR